MRKRQLLVLILAFAAVSCTSSLTEVWPTVQARLPAATPTPEMPTATPTLPPTATLHIPPGGYPRLPTPIGVPPTVPPQRRFVVPDGVIDLAAHPDGCDTLAVTGQVLDAHGGGLGEAYRVRVWAAGVNTTAAAGSEPRWGPGGYQVDVAEGPREMYLFVQLLEATGSAASQVYRVRTLADCEANRIIVNFVPLVDEADGLR